MNLLDCGYIPKLLIASVLFPFTCTPIFRWFPVACPVMADISSKNGRALFLMPPHLNKQKSRLSFGRRQNNTFSYFLLLLQTMYTTWWSTATLSSISSARFVCLSSIFTKGSSSIKKGFSFVNRASTSDSLMHSIGKSARKFHSNLCAAGFFWIF